MDAIEDHFFHATISVGSVDIPNIPTKLYLPKTIHEKPYAIISPPEKIARRIFNSWKVSIKAEIISGDKKILTVDIPEAYIEHSNTRIWGDHLTESTARIQPHNLHIIQHIELEKKHFKTNLTFWITSNKYLTPFTFRSASYKGEIKHQRTEKIIFSIGKNLKIQFDLFFRHKFENHQITQWSHLSCTVKSNISANDTSLIRERILSKIDDFLLLTSFATRHTTKCLGWEAADKLCHTSFYRGNYVFPEKDIRQDDRFSLIPIEDYKNFMDLSYRKIESNKNIDHLRSAIHALESRDNQTIESNFLRVFSGLETLILIFRRDVNMEYALEETQWKLLKKHIKESISSFSKPEIKSEIRANIYSKLDELNRISLKQAYDEFKSKYSIFDSDLWPLFRREGEAGLADIRNKLIHGDTFPRDMMGPISIALDHLKHILERAIIKILEWDIQKTNIQPYFMEADSFRKQIVIDAITQLSNYMKAANPHNSPK